MVPTEPEVTQAGRVGRDGCPIVHRPAVAAPVMVGLPVGSRVSMEIFGELMDWGMEGCRDLFFIFFPFLFHFSIWVPGFLFHFPINFSIWDGCLDGSPGERDGWIGRLGGMVG